MTTVRLDIGKPAHGGHCVARHEGRVVFVRHALPGEVVEAELTDSDDGATFWRADAVTVLEPSPDRVDHPWSLAAGGGGVGGAELGHVALDAQLAWKTAVLAESLDRFAKLEFAGAVARVPGDSERGGLRYRTRITAVTDQAGRPAMSSFRGHALTALDSMPLATEEAEEALLAGTYPAGVPVQITAPAGDGRAQVWVAGSPWRAGRPDKRENAPQAVRESVDVGEVTHHYRVATAGFWQVHRDAPALLASEVVRRVGGAERVLDLYAGAGLFSLPLAAAGARVTAVESDADAARYALRNIHAHPESKVVTGDVRETLRAWTDGADAVVLDPPRSGAGKATLEALGGVGPARIVYVACDPVALARDAATLSTLGYDASDIAAWDLFPMTHHFETIATFERR